MDDQYWYSVGKVSYILDNYLSLRDSKIDHQYRGMLDPANFPFNESSPSSGRRPVVVVNDNNLDFLADIDIAIDKLGESGGWLQFAPAIEDERANENLSPVQKAIADYITGYSYDLAEWVIYRLTDILNGKETKTEKPSIAEPLIREAVAV